jgi:hypothetical protein
MNKKLFGELVESMTQMNEIVRGERAPSRVVQISGTRGKVTRGRKRAKRADAKLSPKQLKKWEGGRDLGAELIRSVREMQAGKVGGVRYIKAARPAKVTSQRKRAKNAARPR